MQRNRLQSLVVHTLDEMKAQDVKVLDVHGVSDVTDIMVIASGSSNRQVKAMASAVFEKAKEHKYRPLGMEGEDAGEWVLVDLGDVVVHLMLPQVRDFYNLEKLWGDAVHGSTNVARGRKPGATVAQAHRAESTAAADKKPARKVAKKVVAKTSKKAAASAGPAAKKRPATRVKTAVKPEPAKSVARKPTVAKRSSRKSGV